MLLCYLCKASHDTGTFKVKRFKVEPCLSWIFSQCWYLGGIKWCTGFKVITRIIWWPDLYCSSVKKQILKNILAHIKRHIPRYRQMCDRSIIITKPSQYVGSYSCINKRYSTVQRSLISLYVVKKMGNRCCGWLNHAVKLGSKSVMNFVFHQFWKDRQRCVSQMAVHTHYCTSVHTGLITP